jgi:type I restriction enzyme S subunit
MEATTAQRTAFPKYPAYRGSGEVWIGEIPMDWELSRLGRWFTERKTKVSDKDYQALSVTKQGVMPQLSSAAKTNDGDNRKLVKAGDFVINSRSDRKGSSGISPLDGSVSLISIVLEPEGIAPEFCHYLLKSNSFVEEYYRVGHGIVADLWTTRYDEMKNIKVAIPSWNEQTAIARFLDEKTAKIDKAITQKERLIALLKERKQIIIQQAVTKGLDPNARMKHSGVEWIGEIPEGWEFEPIKYSLKGIIDCEHKTAPFVDKEDFLVVRTSNVKEGKLTLNDAKYTDEKGFLEWTKRGVPKSGDIILTREAPAGEACIIPDDVRLCLGQRTVWLKINNERLLPEMTIYFIYSKLGRTYIDFLSSGSTVLHFNMADIKNIPIILMPLEEQKEIASYISTINNKIAMAISLKEKEIEKLKEYRSVLIDSAVTGKVKVN